MIGRPDSGVSRRVAGWQERAYGELAVELGFGWQPQLAFAQLNPPPPTDASDASEFVNSMYGERADVDWEAEKQRVERVANENMPGPDRPFESASFYVPASWYLAEVMRSRVWDPHRPLLTPTVATLPTLGMNPVTRVFPSSQEAVIVLQHGVLGYLMHIASVAADITPMDWFAFQRFPHTSSLTRPGAPLQMLRAKEHLTQVLLSYLLAGTSNGVEDHYLAGQGRQNRMEIFQSACLFLIAHEVTHIALRHFASPDPRREAAWNRELMADRMGALATMSLWDENRVHPTVAALGCVMALLATEAMELCVAHLSRGVREPPESQTHPPPSQRVTDLTGYAVVALASAGHESPDELLIRFRRLCEVFRALADTTIPALDELRRAGRRPSPVWRADPPSNLEDDK